MEISILKEILSRLIEGDVQKIASLTNRSRNAVYQVFRKESFVESVIGKALDLIESNAIDNIKFVKEKRLQLKQSADEYQKNKLARQQKQAA